jgi:hypothetical protein
MLKSLGRSIFTFFARPAPTSVALMVGAVPGVAANDDQSQLRRAMRAADEPCIQPACEAEIVQIVEPVCDEQLVAEADNSRVEPIDDLQMAEDAADESLVEAIAPEEDAPGVHEVVAAAGEPESELHVIAGEDGISTAGPAPEIFHVEEQVDMREESPAEIAVELLSEPVAADDAVDFARAEAVEPAQEAAALDDTDDGAPAEVTPEDVAQRQDCGLLEDVAPLEGVAALEDEDVPEDVAETKPRKKRAPAKRKASAKTASRKAKSADEALDVAAEPVPEDDVWVSDAVAWSLSGQWIDGAWSAPESSDCPRRLEELREAAAEGRLTIWGRTGDAGTWQPIDPSYWKSSTVEPASLAEGREKVVAESKTGAKAKGKAKAARKYSALKVSRAQVEELWRPDAMH